MPKLLYQQQLIAFLSCCLVACATPVEGVDEADYGTEPKARDCISQSSIRDYQVLDEGNLIVTSAVKRKFHVVLTRRAFGLRSTWSVGFKSPAGMICPMSGEVIVDDGFAPASYRIRSIQQLSPEDLDDLLIRFGKKEPEIEQTPATQDVDGAEVEELD